MLRKELRGILLLDEKYDKMENMEMGVDFNCSCTTKGQLCDYIYILIYWYTSYLCINTVIVNVL